MSRILSIIIILLSFTAQARWATIEDAPVEVLLNNSNIKIYGNGTSEEIFEEKIKILNEQGRSSYASYIQTYNADTTEIKILNAYTIYKHTQYPVDLAKIEDKPLASTSDGFDQYNQMLISFPKAEIGSELYIKYSIKTNKTALPNFYNNRLDFGNDGCLDNAHITIDTQLPLYIETNDPSKVLNISQSDKDGIQHIELSLKKQICAGSVPGSEIGIINDNKYTWVALSSLNHWHDFAKQTAVKYEEVINQQIPALFLPILNAAKQQNDEAMQINIVTSMVNEKIRYMGNWISIEGAYFPRDLSIIAKLQEDDCKEFSSITAAILRQLGYTAQIALISRGEGEMSIARTLPSTWQFNHAILKVTGRDGKIFWIDPTNLVSMAQGIFPDISEKMAVVLDSNAPSYERIASIDPANSTITFREVLDINDNSVNHSGELTLTGESTLPLAGRELFSSKEAIKDAVFYTLSGENLKAKDKKEMILPDLSSRIVTGLKIKFSYIQDNELIQTNMGPALQVSADWTNTLTNYVPQQLSDIYIGPIRTLRKIIGIKNFQAKYIHNLDYELNTPWIYFKRTCRIIGNDSEIDDFVLVRKSFITSEELESESYQTFRQNIEEHIKNIAIVLK